MSDRGSAPLDLDQPASKIRYTTLLVVLWVLTAIAGLLFGVRLAIRLSLFRRVFVDDGFAFLALAILITNSAVITTMAPPMYEMILVSVGRAPPTPAFIVRASGYLKLQFASTILFWSCLWSVKGCFLAFFYKMTEGMRPYRIALWFVVAITMMSYVGAVITYPVACTSFILGACQKPLNIERSLISLRFSTAMDIITDAMIIAIPVALCWRLRISFTQKIGLFSVLCLGVVIIVFSIVRIIVTNTDGVHPEVSWLALWSAVESSVAVIVACLVSFKALLTQRSRTRTGSNSGGRYYRKYGHGSNSRSREDQIQEYQQRPEEHELQKFGHGGEVSNNIAVDAKLPAVSEESIELRQASFESQAQILRRQ